MPANNNQPRRRHSSNAVNLHSGGNGFNEGWIAGILCSQFPSSLRENELMLF